MSTSSFTHEFPVVWRGQHYMLANCLTHIRRQVPSDQSLLVSYPRFEYVLAPKSEVRIQDTYPHYFEFGRVRKELRVNLRTSIKSKRIPRS